MITSDRIKRQWAEQSHACVKLFLGKCQTWEMLLCVCVVVVGRQNSHNATKREKEPSREQNETD
jgi:hypothetical protein